VSFLLESPLFALGFGILVVVLCGWMWLQTGHKMFLFGVLGTLLVTGLLLLLERSIVTRREQLVDTVQQIARDAQRNDIDLLMRHAYPGGPAYERAQGEIPSYKFYSVRIGNKVDVEINEDSNPPSATVAFMVKLDVEASGHPYIPRQNARVFVTLEMRQDGDTWKVFSYRYDDPLAAMRRRRPSP